MSTTITCPTLGQKVPATFTAKGAFDFGSFKENGTPSRRVHVTATYSGGGPVSSDYTATATSGNWKVSLTLTGTPTSTITLSAVTQFQQNPGDPWQDVDLPASSPVNYSAGSADPCA
jgi:hypothetical protein